MTDLIPENSTRQTPHRHQRLILLATRRLAMQRPDPLGDDLVDVLLEEAGERGWRLLDMNLAVGSLAADDKPAGALVTLLPTDPPARQLRKMGIPTVRLGRLPHPDDELMPAVTPDYTEAATMAVDYFVERGFGNLTVIGHREMMMMPAIEQAFGERAEALGCTAHQLRLRSVSESEMTRQQRIERSEQRAKDVADFLASLPKPVAVLAANGAIAAMINIICHRGGLAVPEDVAVLSLGNAREHCELAPVPISAIDLNRRDLGMAATGTLDRMLRGERVPSCLRVPPREIITRRSTDILAVNDPTVARTIRYIWDRLDVAISVDDVAEAMRTPRYKLERLFRKHLRRGVNAELCRARLERMRELLRSTDLTVDEMAPLVGSRSAKHLHRAFRKAYGQTPRQYRLSVREKMNEV